MQQQERKREFKREPRGKEEVKPNPNIVEAGTRRKADIDHLVEEIDDVLETNAEECGRNYVQKGGQ
jgi:ubiquitin-like protein Pup